MVEKARKDDHKDNFGGLTMAEDDNKKQRVDPPSAWCSPVVGPSHSTSSAWTYTPPPCVQQSTATTPPSLLPPFSMPSMRAGSPPRFFFPFPDSVASNSSANSAAERDPAPPPPREEKFMRYRDPKFPLAGLMKEEGGVVEWMRKNKKRVPKTDE